MSDHIDRRLLLRAASTVTVSASTVGLTAVPNATASAETSADVD